MKVILGAVLAAIIAGAAFAQPAEAACFWNGRFMECWHHPHAWSWHHHDWRGDRW
jgi:hypothetical protein